MDRILMEGMAFFGRHGVFPAERELGARFTVDVELMGDLREAAASDRLDDTVNVLGLRGELELDVRREARGHLTGVRVEVLPRAERRRNLPQLEQAVREAELPARVRDLSLQAIGRLGSAESRIHDVPVD